MTEPFPTKTVNMKDVLFLFDIDGTMIDVRDDGKRAVISAIKESLSVNVRE